MNFKVEPKKLVIKYIAFLLTIALMAYIFDKDIAEWVINGFICAVIFDVVFYIVWIKILTPVQRRRFIQWIQSK